MTRAPSRSADATMVRPVLASHVAVRRHLVGGQEQIALCDLRSERVAVIGAREWTLLRCADGSRDLEGIAAAAARRGHYATVHRLRAFLVELDRAGMLARSGEDELDAVAPAQARSSAPLDPLPDYQLDCDGRGTCCRIYPTVLFDPLEAARARSLCPERLAGSEDEERVFTPERGSAARLGAGRLRGLAVTLIDGRCAYLADDDLCELHRAAGPSAKPMGCRLFPATYTDDGEAVRISVAPECACVFRSVGGRAGEPLVPRGARSGADLDPAVYVEQLVDPVPLTLELSVRRSEYVRWSRAVARRFADAVSAEQGPLGRMDGRQPDPVDQLWSLADAVGQAGLEKASTDRALGAPSAASAGEMRPWVAGLRCWIERRRAQERPWRSHNDVTRIGLDAMLSACRRVEAGGGATQAPAQRGTSASSRLAELFYLQALFHGHRVLGGLPLVAALRDRAVRLAVARALPRVEKPRDFLGAAAIWEVPLALCEAMVRGHGLEGYAAVEALGLAAELRDA